MCWNVTINLYSFCNHYLRFWYILYASYGSIFNSSNQFLHNFLVHSLSSKDILTPIPEILFNSQSALRNPDVGQNCGIARSVLSKGYLSTSLTFFTRYTVHQMTKYSLLQVLGDIYRYSEFYSFELLYFWNC
jgi:hypothetical protein